MLLDNPESINSLTLTVFETDPPTGSLTTSGLMWYNAASGSIRFTYNATGSNVWTIVQPMNTARTYAAGTGTQNASLAIGGELSGGFGLSCTEEYNGFSWVAGGTLNGSRNQGAAAGIQNAALVFGGGCNNNVFSGGSSEKYNGTSWSNATGTLITCRSFLAGVGTQNSALAFGGSFAATTYSCTEAYNGTSWSVGGALICARWSLAGAGTQNATLAFGGAPGGLVNTEAYNGTSWSSGNGLIQGRFALAGAGIQNAALAFGGGSSPRTAFTEAYNGISWSSCNSLVLAKNYLAGAGTQNASLAFAGLTDIGTNQISSGTEAYVTPYCAKSALFT